MHTLTIDQTTKNNAWYRQLAAVWARQMMTGELPGTWAYNTESEVRFAIQKLNLQPGHRVLDLGCGWGRHSIILASYGLNVTGVDIARDLLTLARYNARRSQVTLNLVEADIATMPFSGSFDAIAQFCGNLLTWFANYEQTLDALLNVARLLKPGGRFVFGTPEWQPELPPRTQYWTEWEGGAAIYRQKFDPDTRIHEAQTVVFGPDHERQEYRRQTWWPSRQDMEALFEEAGLEVCGRYNTFADELYWPDQDGLVYVLARECI